ncbi:MAG: tRNA epoxyqueuosine(34) reductase QueG [Anaerolineales bacterium]|jgi:epoxyqueuosine reductase
MIDKKAHELKRRLKAEVHRLGLDLAGITSPDPPPHLDVYRRWVHQDKHGEMHYLASERAMARRSDPRLILPECQSILVVGANYLPAPMGDADRKADIRVAAYAQGFDYHEVLLERLAQLVSFLEQQLGEPIAHRLYCDTGPVLERELAQRAGLGWIGKNTCLIHPKLGSYFLLAVAFLGIPLAPDTPTVHDFCGSCNRCIEACPTGCILPDRTLDARRCISYLTIELKGMIPEPQRASIGNWLFGCDLCQEVCPWNLRFSRPTKDQAFMPRPILQQAELPRFLNLSAPEYQTELRGSPLRRAKRAGLVRNAAVVAGNRGGPELASVLENVLQGDPDALVRAHAAWALGRINTSAAQAALAQAYQLEQEPSVRDAIDAALKAFPER